MREKGRLDNELDTRGHGLRGRAVATLSVITGAVAVIGAALALVVAGPWGHDQQPSATGAGQTGQPPQSWRMVFNSDFTGNTLKTSSWGTCYPWSPVGCTNFGNNGEEKEWYTASQAQVLAGVLRLNARRTPTAGLDQSGASQKYACRSGMVTTYPSLRFKYGYVQITAHIPAGIGLWSAFWLAAASLRWPPEIDIAEHWAADPYVKTYLHPLAGPQQGGPVATPGLLTGWHAFALSWTESRLTWYYDGHQVMTTTTGVPQQDMYLIANLAVFNAGPGGCSGSLLIRSVKVWQPKN